MDRENKIKGKTKEEIDGLRKTVARLEGRFEPQLTILFEQNKAPYKELYQNDTWQFRVGIISPNPISNAELIVNKLYVDGVHHDGIHLRPRHDRNERGTKRVALTAFKPEFWDVVSTPHWGIMLSNIPPLGDIRFMPGNYEFELMASGGDSPPTTAIVNMEINSEYEISRFEVRDGRLSDLFIRN